MQAHPTAARRTTGIHSDPASYPARAAAIAVARPIPLPRLDLAQQVLVVPQQHEEAAVHDRGVVEPEQLVDRGRRPRSYAPALRELEKSQKTRGKRRQLDVIDDVNARADAEGWNIRVLTGIEVDILDDGRLDQTDELLDRLDVVVASVHSKLRMDSDDMTKRMVTAIANPRVDVLGHCTGRLITGGRGTRPESTFDADIVFAACERFGVAVEINSRPERLDPPMRLLRDAVEAGCRFSIDTDAHAPGQLEWQPYGCERGEVAGVPPERIVNTWPVDDLLAWTHH